MAKRTKTKQFAPGGDKLELRLVILLAIILLLSIFVLRHQSSISPKPDTLPTHEDSAESNQ